MDLLYALFNIFIPLFLLKLAMILLGDCDVVLQLAEKFGRSPKSLKNKVVWITGASSGIGEYLAYELAKVGCRLILSARSLPQLEKVKQECIKVGNLYFEDVMTIHLDMAEFSTHQSAVDEVISKFGKVDIWIHEVLATKFSTLDENIGKYFESLKKTKRDSGIDILVNNAARSQIGLWYKTSIEVHQQLLNVNVLGVLSLTNCVLPHMVRRNEGHIVNTSGLAGKKGLFLGGAYAGTKHAIQGLFDSLRLELIGTKIAVTNVCPAHVYSNIAKTALGERPGEEPNLIKYSRKHMSTQRCAELYAIAIANKLTEVWISVNPALCIAYLTSYSPAIGNLLFRIYKPVVVAKKTK